MVQADYVWMNGEVVAFEDAKVPLLTHALHYGTGVFEGVRCYDTPRGPAVFRHRDHIDRLFQSAALWYMDVPYTKDEVRSATNDLILRNGFRSCYIRPIAYRGSGPMGLDPLGNEVELAVAVWEWGAYLGDAGQREGIRVKVSSWRRMSSDSFIPHAKASGQYLNSVLARIEATKAGYDEGILLDAKGDVSEGTGENVFVVYEGVIATPPQSADILDGITRRSVMQIARDLGYEVVERDIARAELVLADEVFLTGTAAELTPVREVDDHPLGEPGPVTREVQRTFHDALRGRGDRYLDWLDIVPVPSQA
jgi:branched-chain amino acid aminotransferase